jgi:hypothetical protein
MRTWKLRISLLCVLMTVGMTGIVLAANAHFNSASARRQGNNLIVSFKISGLGNNQTITVTASARATAVYQCFNNGGNHPQAGNKEQVIANVSASGSFTSDRNGSVSGSLTLTPPPPTLQCPSGQHLVLVSVKYENVSVSGGGASQSIGGTF